MNDWQPQRFKPRAKALLTFNQLPLDRALTVQAKTDGEFTVVSYQKDVRVFSTNLWGTIRGEGSPWLKEVREALQRQANVAEATFLAETYGMDGERMLKLPQVIHGLKGGDIIAHEKIRLGVFDVVSINGKTLDEPYPLRLRIAEEWFQGLNLVHVLPWIQPKTLQELNDFWSHYVEQRDYEGLFARDDMENLYKVKPFFDLDCALIGLNKRNLWSRQEITSLKLAVIDEDGSYIEIGDVASGIDHQLRQELYKQLLPYKKAEYNTWVQVKPFVVVQVQAMELFPCTKPRYLNKDGFLEPAGSKQAYSLRHPRLIRFRGEKNATVEDIGYERQLLSWRLREWP